MTQGTTQKQTGEWKRRTMQAGAIMLCMLVHGMLHAFC